MQIKIGSTGTIIRLSREHSCEVTPNLEAHPATHTFSCLTCGHWFHFCGEHHGPATLRILKHNCNRQAATA